MECKKCSFDGVTIKPDGMHELDPCVYEDIEMYVNATVIISRCKKCGHIEVSWKRQEDTEEIDLRWSDGHDE